MRIFDLQNDNAGKVVSLYDQKDNLMLYFWCFTWNIVQTDI